MKQITRTLFLILIFSWSFLSLAAVSAQEYENLEQSLYIWRLINETRQDPALTLSKLGVDVDSLRDSLGGDSWILDRKLEPLALNLNLIDSADKHCMDMLKRGYLDYASSDSAPPVEFRVLLSGYQALKTGESLGALTFDTFREPFESARVIFINMVKDELLVMSSLDCRILNDSFTEVGISMRSGFMRLGSGETKRAHVVVMDYGQPVEARSYYIGNVVRPGESLLLDPEKAMVSGVLIVFRDVFRNIVQTAAIDLMGAYQFSKYSSGYMAFDVVDTLDGVQFMTLGLWGGAGNEILDFKVDH